MKKLFKKIMATVITASMALSALPAFAADGDYINIVNTNGAYNGKDSSESYIGVENLSGTLAFSEDGFGSKPAGDKFAKITSPVDAENHRILVHSPAITWDDTNKARVFVAEMDFVPVAGVKAARLCQRYAALSQAFELSGANKNDWNHIKFEVDLNKNIIGVELNGEKVRDSALAQNLNWDLMTQMRIQFEGDGVGDADKNIVLYSDNVKMYTKDSIENVYVNDSFIYDTAISQHYTINAVGSKSYVAGAGGKAADDRALDIVTDSTNNTYLGINIPVTSEYIKVQYNIMPKANFVRLSNQARNITLHYDMMGVLDNETPANRNLVPNQWNKIELLLQNYTKYNDTTEAMKFGTKLYVNGTLISNVDREGQYGKEGVTSNVFPLRIRAVGANAEFLMDDLKIMTSDTEFTQDDVVSLQGKANSITEPTKITNGTVSAYTTSKVSDFSANGATVRVFTDNTYNEELADTDVLEVGNVIVTEDSNNRIKYYNVTELTQDPTLQPIDVNENFDNQSCNEIYSLHSSLGNASYVSGVAGKSAFDYSMKADKTTTAQTDIYLEYQAVPSSAEFVTVEYNLLPDENFAETRLGAKSSVVVGPIIKNSVIKAGQWNKIKFVFRNLETSKTAVGESCAMKADVYVNGKCISSNSDAKAQLSSEGKYQIRIIASSTAAATPMTVYYDDVKIKTYESMPAVNISVPELAIDPNCGLVDNDAKTILVYSGATADDIDSGAFDLAAYTDNTFTEQVTGELSAGNIIVVSNADKDMFYYTVVPGSMTIDRMEFAYSSDNTSYADASKTDIKNGYYKYTVTASNTTNDDKKVTSIIALYNSADKLVDVKYNTMNVASGSTAIEVSALMQITNAAAGMKIKTFVWDTIENAKPYETDPVRILVIGNSITQHNASSSLGWNGTWGMAASSEDKDYVHQLISKINTKTTDYELKYRNVAEFEKYFYDFGKFVTDNYKELADFDADIIISTIGANCNNSSNELDPEYNAPYAFSADYYEKIINFFNADGKAKVIAGKTVLTTNAVLNAIDAAAALHPEWKLVDMTSYTGDEYNATSYYTSYPDVFASNISEAVIGHPGDKAMEAMANDLWNVLPDIMDSVR